MDNALSYAKKDKQPGQTGILADVISWLFYLLSILRVLLKRNQLSDLWPRIASLNILNSSILSLQIFAGWKICQFISFIFDFYSFYSIVADIPTTELCYRFFCAAIEHLAFENDPLAFILKSNFSVNPFWHNKFFK